MRKLAIFAGSFSLGIFLAQYLLAHTYLLSTAFLCLFLAIASLFLPQLWRRRGMLVFTALALALGYSWLYHVRVQKPMQELSSTETSVQMTLCDYAADLGNKAKATVSVEGLPAKVVYYGDDALLNLEPGQTFTDVVLFQDASRIRDDDVTTFTSKGIFLLAYSRDSARLVSESEFSLRWLPVRLKHSMQNMIRNLFRGDAAGFISAILTGDKSQLSTQAETDLSEAGIYHILAVSGMHCGFLLALVALLLGKQRRYLIAAVGIPLLFFYAVLTGASPSVVRACVMLSLLLAAPLFQRENDGPTALATALFLILLKNPYAAASISLQLSFAAMGGILWLTPKLYAFLIQKLRKGRVSQILSASISASLGAMVFSIPISAYYFGSLVVIAPISNLLCLWAASVIFILGMLAVLCGMLFFPLAMLLAIIPQHLTGYLLDIAHVLAKIPYHALYFVNPYLKYWLLFLYSSFFIAYLGKGKRKYIIASIASVAALVLTISLGSNRYNGKLETIVLDVGQGQSVIFSSGDHYALVDCGSANSWVDAGNAAADYLLSMGCKSLDWLVITHYDQDHINGLDSLLSRISVDCLLVSEYSADDALSLDVLETADQYGTTIEYVKSLSELSLGAAEVLVFPPVGEKADDNEQGLSLLATLDTRNILITGDMNTSTEKHLMETYQLPDLDVLIAGHHGSQYATSDELLDTLTPETVCISVGTNQYGHPAYEMLYRLADHECTVYRTDLHGNIRLSWN